MPSPCPTFRPTASNEQLNLKTAEKHKIIETKYGCPWDFIPQPKKTIGDWAAFSAKAADPHLTDIEAQSCCFTGQMVKLLKPTVQANLCRKRLISSSRINADGSESILDTDKSKKYCGEPDFDIDALNKGIIDCCMKRVSMYNAATGRSQMVFQRDLACHQKITANHGITIAEPIDAKANLRKCFLPGMLYLQRHFGTETSVNNRRRACFETENQFVLAYLQLQVGGLQVQQV
jgi:hypothetical protein